MAPMTWRPEAVPDLTGRTMIVTGANSGIGLEAARQLAARGAAVTLAARDLAKGEAALADLATTATGPLELAELDLADLASVRDFAKGWRDAHPEGLDVLVNNAGVMAIPRRETVDGFEMQLGTNHLGHFALTGLLLDALTEDGRVVTVSSGAHRMGRMDFDDLQGERRYQAWRAYGQSKLANLLFALELHRRAEAAGLVLRSIAVHPGWAATNLQAVGPSARGNRLEGLLVGLGNRVLAQSAQAGAWPTVMGATDPDVPSGAFLGPTQLFHQRGLPGYETPSVAARDVAVAGRLWEVSEALTGVVYPG
jgi:NAD(P)-dependent dehydrogenase (short-subunit alcohol dehydrogenase family)